MDSNGAPSQPSFGVANSPSAPPSDTFYPSLHMETKDCHEDPPPPYNFTGGHNVSHQAVPQGTHQGPTQGQQQPTQGQQQPTQRQQQPMPINNMTPPVQVTTHQSGPPSITATSNHPQPVQIVLQGDLGGSIPPGVCHVCKKGKIKDSATCCSWVSCFLLLPFGIIPGLIAFCYACRKPKCTRCGFVHGKKK